jgi:hypothetical protein
MKATTWFPKNGRGYFHFWENLTLANWRNLPPVAGAKIENFNLRTLIGGESFKLKK